MFNYKGEDFSILN